MASIGTTTSIPPVDFPPWFEYSSSTWELQMKFLRGDRLSQPYLCRKTNTLRFVLNTLDSVYGLIIPVDAHLGPDSELVMLMDFHKPEGAEVFLFGYNSAFIHGHCTSNLHILNYSWPEPDGAVKPSDSLVATLDGDRWMYLTSDFDEGSGRVVMCSYKCLILLHCNIYISNQCPRRLMLVPSTMSNTYTPTKSMECAKFNMYLNPILLGTDTTQYLEDPQGFLPLRFYLCTIQAHLEIENFIC